MKELDGMVSSTHAGLGMVSISTNQTVKSHDSQGNGRVLSRVLPLSGKY